jgi:glycogen operon protein
MAKDVFEFTRSLIAFRKEHKVLHLKEEPRQMDYMSFGLPDMSYHGTKAWYADFSYFNRHFSTMYCGKYATTCGHADEPDIYIAYNMYWKPQQFGIPAARNKKQWEVAFSTEASRLTKDIEIGRLYSVPARSITVLIAR